MRGRPTIDLLFSGLFGRSQSCCRDPDEKARRPSLVVCEVCVHRLNVGRIVLLAIDNLENDSVRKAVGSGRIIFSPVQRLAAGYFIEYAFTDGVRAAGRRSWIQIVGINCYASYPVAGESKCMPTTRLHQAPPSIKTRNSRVGRGRVIVPARPAYFLLSALLERCFAFWSCAHVVNHRLSGTLPSLLVCLTFGVSLVERRLPRFLLPPQPKMPTPRLQQVRVGHAR